MHVQPVPEGRAGCAVISKGSLRAGNPVLSGFVCFSRLAFAPSKSGSALSESSLRWLPLMSSTLCVLVVVVMREAAEGSSAWAGL